VRQLIEARLQAELRKGAARGISEGEVVRDWAILQKTVGDSDSTFANRVANRNVRAENIRGNRP